MDETNRVAAIGVSLVLIFVALLITFAAMIIALLGLTVIILEVMPDSAGSVKVAKIAVGDARIGTDEIAHQLETELRSVPRLRNLEVRVASRGSRADVHLDLLVDSEADVVETASIVIQRAREIVEGRMGIQLERPPRAEVHFRDEKSVHKAASPPMSAPSLQPAATQRPAPSTISTDQSVSTSEPIHEATPTVHEDRPAGA